MNWDDLRVVAAVRDEGTYAAASLRLRIDETTVARRLARIERRLGVRLFEAVDGVRKPTEQCALVLDHVRAIAGHVAQIDRIGPSLPALSGRFRVALTVGIAEEIVAPRAAAFLKHHPGISLSLLTAAENVNFSRWEADLAIRLGKPRKGNFAISKLAEMRLYLIEPAEPDGGPIVCAYPQELDLIPETRFLKAKGLHERARLVTSNLRVIRALIASRRALGVLPDYICEDLLADPHLRATPLAQRRDVWLLVQHHLKRDRAARAVIEWLRGCFREGMSPNS